MADILSNVGTVLESAVVWCGHIVSAVVNTPLLMIPFSLSMALFGVHLFKSLRS